MKLRRAVFVLWVALVFPPSATLLAESSGADQPTPSQSTQHSPTTNSVTFADVSSGMLALGVFLILRRGIQTRFRGRNDLSTERRRRQRPPALTATSGGWLTPPPL
jgi:hypothetical protein